MSSPAPSFPVDRPPKAPRPRIAVLFGGRSNEHAVSLHSAATVLRNLDPARYDVLPVGVSPEGTWYTYAGPADAVENGTWACDGGQGLLAPVVPSPDPAVHGLLELMPGGEPRPMRLDLVFPVLHGRFGEDGTVQGIFELAGVPVAGCGVLSSAVGMDKDRAHRLVQAAGVAVPRSVTVESWERAQATELIARANLTYPLFVKPVRSGSSYGISIIRGPHELPAALDAAFAHDSRVVVEERVPGFEVGCAIVGRQDDPFVGRVDEVQVPSGFLDYAEKYERATAQIHMPARIDAATELRVQQEALKVWRALDCDGLARVDLFLTPDGELVFNEVNTLPGLTAVSRFPQMMKGAGLELPQLMEKIVGLYLR